MSARLTEPILGYDVFNGYRSVALRQIESGIESGDKHRWLACINPHSYAESLKNDRFRSALESADWLVPDGVGIVLGSLLFGGSIRERITGSDIFEGVMAYLEERGGGKVFFLGSTEQTLAKIRERLARDYPRIELAGMLSPPFRPVFSDDDLREMIDAVNRAEPDVLWVGLTAPKQELWIHQNLGRLTSVKFAGAIGAVFDFYAGNVKRSHPVFRNLGLEWLPRLAQQPIRLGKRMLVSAPVFFWHVLRARILGNQDPVPPPGVR